MWWKGQSFRNEKEGQNGSHQYNNYLNQW
jgi:hypothetical protein